MRLIYINTLYLVWILVSTPVSILSGLKTRFCDHHEFESRLRETLKCSIHNLNKILTTEYGVEQCNNINRQMACLNNEGHIGTCLDEEKRRDIKFFTEWLLSLDISQLILPCPKLKTARKDFKKKKMETEKKYKSGNKELIASIISFDKNTSFNGFKINLMKYKDNKKTNKMLEAYYIYGSQTFNAYGKCIQERMFPLIVNLGFGLFDDFILPCHVFVDIHDDCMRPNEHLSDRDRTLLKQMAITGYKSVMEALIKKESRRFVIAAINAIDPKFNDNLITVAMKNIRHDFKVIYS